MPKTPAKFKQVDVSRAIRGAAAAGLDVARVEVRPDGAIALYTATAGADLEGVSPLDQWIKAHGQD